MQLIFGASIEVQIVIFILIALSITSWGIIVQRYLVLAAAEKGVLNFE